MNGHRAKQIHRMARKYLHSLPEKKRTKGKYKQINRMLKRFFYAGTLHVRRAHV